jgi:hypothetical protein
MKANELMIGDWVMINSISYYQVEQIRMEFGELRIYLKGTEVFATENEIMPIPLTPEILEKNGFKWTTRKSYMVSRTGTVCMIWGFYKDCLSISDHSDDGGCQISSLKCKFVHQLQHALRLCGISEQIKL